MGAEQNTTTSPCLLCAKKIIQTGIRKVVFAEAYPDRDATALLEEAGIDVVRFEGATGRAYQRLYTGEAR